MAMIRFRPLKAEEVECRVAQCSEKGCSLLLYKTSRTDMDLLDETVGAENWQKDYKTIDGKLFCGIGIKCDGEWIWKWDTGTPSNMEAQKGEASDAAKRSGFVWGIGRELYTAPFIWVGADKCKRLSKRKDGKWACYDDFRVTELHIEEGRIVKLQICNASNRMAVVYGPRNAAGGPDAAKDEPMPLMGAKKRLWAAVSRYAELRGEDPNEVIAALKEKDGWEDTADYYNAKAELFEKELP